jgi:phosphopantothenoylcysteine decarboxylase / phosphopantothenate---cysteine ligase
MHFLITAGPTREYLDPVRFLTNGSTGKMGYACAAAALKRDHRVTLISGPVSIPVPQKAELVSVVSAAEMFQAVRKYFSSCDCVIMTAAVSDYRPQHCEHYKIPKTEDDCLLKLERTEDILAHLGKIRQKQILIGFAVQDKSARKKAQDKLRQKNLDAILLNSPSSFGADQTDMQLLTRTGVWEKYPGVQKEKMADTIILLAEKLLLPSDE